MKRLFEALLLECSGIGQGRLGKLKKIFGNAEKAWWADRQELYQSGLFQKQEGLQSFLKDRKSIDPQSRLRLWQQHGIGLCGIEDSNYPSLLRNIFDPPELLFYRGRIPVDSKMLAIVGSRKSTPYGRNVARSFAQTLSQNGISIVSGAARGIDTAAHEGALAVGGTTIAVLGSGVDIVYPPENGKLLEQIANHGCILSEYPPGTPPAAGRFPARNRIVAGLCMGVLVVEAAHKSGALITADLALNENREVFAVPGSVFSEASIGTNRLIQQGARLVCSAQEILSDFGLGIASRREESIPVFSPQEQAILDMLSPEIAKSVDEILELTSMSLAELQFCLLGLELSGHVEKDFAMRYSKRTIKE